jgi:threonyl-tRNA synthetase
VPHCDATPAFEEMHAMKDEENLPYEQTELYRLRHTAAHVMAQAVLELFPQAKIAIGPPIIDGFYYDFDLGVDENGRPVTFAAEDLEGIEKSDAPDHRRQISAALPRGNC